MLKTILPAMIGNALVLDLTSAKRDTFWGKRCRKFGFFYLFQMVFLTLQNLYPILQTDMYH